MMIIAIIITTNLFIFIILKTDIHHTMFTNSGLGTMHLRFNNTVVTGLLLAEGEHLVVTTSRYLHRKGMGKEGKKREKRKEKERGRKG
jgi:hypothetical protein